MHFSVSDVRQYLTCPQMAAYAQVERRVPLRHYAVAADAGTLWHLACEAKLLGQGPGEAVEAKLSEWQRSLDSEYFEELLAEWKPLALLIPHVDFSDMEVLAVEVPITKTLPCGHDFIGRADAVVKWKGLHWHLQHKTVGPSKPLAIYMQHMQVDWHECLYEWVLSEQYPLWGGTLLTLARKLSARTIEKMGWQAALSRTPIARPRAVVDRAVVDFDRLVWEIAGVHFEGRPVIQNRSACTGTFGNRPCAYFDVCHGKAKLSDDTLFGPAVARYDVQSPGGSAQDLRQTEQ